MAAPVIVSSAWIGTSASRIPEEDLGRPRGRDEAGAMIDRIAGHRKAAANDFVDPSRSSTSGAPAMSTRPSILAAMKMADLFDAAVDAGLASPIAEKSSSPSRWRW